MPLMKDSRNRLVPVGYRWDGDHLVPWGYAWDSKQNKPVPMDQKRGR